MSYEEHWVALAAQIRGLLRAGELYALFQSYQQEDSYGAGRYLREQCSAVVRSIEEFRDQFALGLPTSVVARIDYFLGTATAKAAKEDTGQRGARGALVALAGLETEITFLLTGRQEFIRARSERAFLHLQRSLAADPDVSAKWNNALQDGEVACERLGSVHLLSHGIFAFKVDARGARTDLIFNEPPPELLVARGIEGMVLTEWKIASDAKSGSAGFVAARAQADLYAQGVLAGTELSSHRYLIVVTQKELPLHVVPADDLTARGMIYRHVNIVIQPKVPSKAAKKPANPK
jgi:hypothetical protein